MGRMIFTDRGRALLSTHEELTRWRWAKKVLVTPAKAVGAPADLWIYASHYRQGPPLAVAINGKSVGQVTASAKAAPEWAWHRLALPRLKASRCEITLTTDTLAMNGWSLGLDPSVSPRGSALSLDGGKSWQNRSMGAHHALRGEYMIRLRSHATDLPELRPPKIVYEDVQHPRVCELAEVIPASIRRIRRPWAQVLALRTWICRQWQHDPKGTVYSPWDAATILDWKRRGSGHGGNTCIAMCVHFGTVMTALASSLGHRARSVATTKAMGSGHGHFLSEIFDEKLDQWVVHDPNCDTHFEDGRPLSALEVHERAAAGVNLLANAKSGKGLATQPHWVISGFRDVFGSAACYRQMAVWTRNDYTSDPTVGAPTHGTIEYSETDWVWSSISDAKDTAMFPYHSGDPAYFQSPA